MTLIGKGHDFDGGGGDVAATTGVKTFAKDGNLGPVGTDDGAPSERFALGIFHSIDQDGVAIVDQTGHGDAAAGGHKLFITGKEFAQRASAGVDGKPGAGRVVEVSANKGATFRDPLHDDAGIGPPVQLFGETDWRDPAVDDLIGLTEATDFDDTVMLAGRIGGLIDSPGPLGPRG